MAGRGMTKPKDQMFHVGARLSAIERHLVVADRQRARAIELVEGIEALTGKLADLPAIPLDVLDRYERAIVTAHTSNLLRLPSYGSLSDDEGRAA